MSSEVLEAPRCDRPACFNCPMEFLIDSNPWTGAGTNFPPPANSSLVVRRCKEHLHEEGHFTREESRGAVSVLAFFLRQAERARQTVDKEDQEQREQAEERVRHFRFVYAAVRFKFGD